ncbi:hypothetical protein ACIBG7_35800 [Nonomuraea sp. NPDC050328]|uniref:hypothetical protein n=1 Tax=Nonomuraea sp. NPDC050328 TaxID=3364361 RepID=UPI00379232C6
MGEVSHVRRATGLAGGLAYAAIIGLLVGLGQRADPGWLREPAEAALRRLTYRRS